MWRLIVVIRVEIALDLFALIMKFIGVLHLRYMFSFHFFLNLCWYFSCQCWRLKSQTFAELSKEDFFCDTWLVLDLYMCHLSYSCKTERENGISRLIPNPAYPQLLLKGPSFLMLQNGDFQTPWSCNFGAIPKRMVKVAKLHSQN